MIPPKKAKGFVDIALEVSYIHFQAFNDHIHQLLGKLLHLLIVFLVRIPAIAETVAFSSCHKEIDKIKKRDKKNLCTFCEVVLMLTQTLCCRPWATKSMADYPWASQQYVHSPRGFRVPWTPSTSPRSPSRRTSELASAPDREAQGESHSSKKNQTQSTHPSRTKLNPSQPNSIQSKPLIPAESTQSNPTPSQLHTTSESLHSL
jgi:hypothetical protein